MPTLLRVRTRLPANTLCELAARVTCVVSGAPVSPEGCAPTLVSDPSQSCEPLDPAALKPL